MPGGNIRVYAPDGELGEMPEDQWGQEAEAAGFTRALRVVAPDGEPGWMPVTQWGTDAESAGFKMAGASEVAAPIQAGMAGADGTPDAESPNTSALEKLQTFGEGIAQGAALGARTPIDYAEGASTWLGNKAFELMNPNARSVGFDESLETAKRNIAKREAANPYTSGAGKAFGAVVPTLATGGAGALAKGASYAPTALLSQAASKAATLMSAPIGGVGAAAAWKIAEGATKLGVQGAIEGGAWGATHEIDKAAESGDWDGIAQRAWAGLTSGAEVGALASMAVGGAIKGAEKAYGAAKRSGAAAKVLDWVDQLDQSADDVAQPAQSGAGAAADTADDVAFRPGLANVDPAAAQTARGPLVSSEIPNAQRRLKSMMRSAGKGIDETYSKATRAIRADFDELLRAQNVIDERGGIAAKRAASSAYNVEGAKVGMQEFAPMIGQTRQNLQGLVDEYGEAALQSRGGLTTVKHVQSILKSAEKRIAAKLEAGEIGDAFMVGDDAKRALGQAQNTKNPLVESAMQSEYGRWQSFLEDESIWGELAARQKAANPAWTERIRRGNDQRMGSFFVRSGEAADNPFEQLTQANDSTIAGFIRKLGDDGNDGAEEALRRYMRASALDAQARANAWGTDALREQAAKVRTMALRIEDTLDAVAAARRGAQKWKNVEEAVKGIPFAEAGVGVIGSAARKVAAIGGEDAIEKVARATVATRKAAVQAQERIEAASNLRRLLAKNNVAAKAATRQALTLRAVEKRVAALDDESDDERNMQRAMQAIGTEHPELADAVWRQNEMRKSFLREKLGPQPVDAVGRPRDRTKTELQEFKKYVEPADDPLSAIERMSEGVATREDIDTIKALYPAMYDDFVAKAMDRVDDSTPLKKRIRISQAIGMPTDDALTPNYIAAMQKSARSGVADEQIKGQAGRGAQGPAVGLKSDRLSAR